MKKKYEKKYEKSIKKKYQKSMKKKYLKKVLKKTKFFFKCGQMLFLKNCFVKTKI